MSATPPRPTAMLAALAGATLLSAMGSSVATVVLPSLAPAFGATMADLQWIMLAYLLTMTITIVAAGRLGDLHGHRRVLVSGLGLFIIASLAGAASSSLGILVAARAVQGIGGAILMAMPMSLARNAFPASRTASVMGLLATMSAIGTALGPSLGGAVIAGFGWQGAFLLLGVGGVAVLVLAISVLPVTPLQVAPSGRWLQPAAMILDRGIGTGLAANLLMGAVIMTTLVVGALFLSFGLGLNEVETGLVMAVGPLVAAFAGVPAGRLADRLGYHRAMMIGLAEIAAGSVCLAFLPIVWGVTGYVAALVVLTPGFQLFLAANNASIMRKAPDAQRGMASGLLGLSRNLGLLLGASAMAALFGALIGTDRIAIAPRGSIGAAFTTVFLLAAGLAVVAAALALYGRPKAPAAAS